MQADYWAHLYDLLDKQQSSARLADTELAKLKEKEDVLRDAFKEFATIESNFLLIGEDGLYNTFRDYAARADAFFKAAYLDNADLTSDKMNAYRGEFKTLRQSLLKAIHNAYKKPA